MVKVKTWWLTVERAGQLMRVKILAPTKRLAVLNYRCEVSYADVILKVGLERINPKNNR